MAARPALYTAQRRAPFRLTLKGSPSLAEPLGAALWAQWSYGFPTMPRQHGPQLTHGFLQYPAGMQPLAAQHLLALLPSGVLLDPFVGGGTTLIEALRGGRHPSPIGADLSPLAIFASTHHLWPASDDELAQLRAQARCALQAAGELGEGAPTGAAPNPNPNPTPNPNPSPSLSPNPNPSPSPSPGLSPSSYAGQESCMSRLDGPLHVAPRVVRRRARCASAAGCSSAIAAVLRKVRGASGRLS